MDVRLPSVTSGLEPLRTTLPNGIVVLAKETRRVPAVAINLAVRGGAVCDPDGQPGALYLLSRVVDRGTASRSAAEIAEEFDSRGITLTSAVTRHSLTLTCTCLAEDFDAVFALLGEIVTSPTIPEVELTRRKAEVITAVRQDDDNPAVRAVESLMALLYPEPHPYGRRSKGTIDVIEGLTRDGLVRLHRKRFAPSALTVVVVGDVAAPRVLDVTSRLFDAWPVPPPPPVVLPAIVPATGRRRLILPMMNKVQVDLAYGFTAIRRADPAYYACWLMNNVLGQYSMGGRLGESIRERQGMAYYAFSTLDADLAEGPLTIRAGISPANVDRTIASIDAEIDRLTREGVTPKELRDSQQYLIGSMPRALETNGGIANFLQTAELFGLGADYDLRLPDLLRAITVEQVQEAARRLLDPARAAIVMAGPYADEGHGIE
jgi:zinc protease